MIQQRMSLSNGKRRKSVLIALDWYDHEMNLGFAQYAREVGWIVDDCFSRGSRLFAPGWPVDGIVTVLQSKKSPLAKIILNSNVPVVNLTNHLPELPFPKVLADNVAIGRLAAEELIGRGFRNFAFFAIDTHAWVVNERMTGFRESVLSIGCRFDLIDFTKEIVRPGGGERLMSSLGRKLKKLPKPVAIMAQYDGEANLIVRACIDAGLQVPEDVAVMGVDNDPIYGELSPVPLSSVITNRKRQAYAAAELLDRLMNGAAAPKKPIRIPPSGIILRRSTDVFASDDIHVLKALTFIKEHLSESFTIDQIVKASGISRRSLYIRFAKNVGRSLGKEINRLRINHAKNLLSTTNLKIETIANQCGIDGCVALSKLFKTHTGLAPSIYRERFSAISYQ